MITETLKQLTLAKLKQIGTTRLSAKFKRLLIFKTKTTLVQTLFSDHEVSLIGYPDVFTGNTKATMQGSGTAKKTHVKLSD